jgi:hypothetical protein
MSKKFSVWLYKISKGWVTLLGIVIFLGFTALVLPAQSAQSEATRGGVGSPDTSFFYTPNDIYGFAEASGEDGRREYIRARFTFDILWPIVYAFFLATSTSWVFQRITYPEDRWRVVNLAPVTGMFFDLLENISASIVVGRFPETTPIIEWLVPLFSLLKWGFIAASFGLLMMGILIWAARRGRKLISNQED